LRIETEEVSGMFRYLVRRALLMVPTLLGVAVLIFFLMRVIPGDIVVLKYAKDGQAVSEEIIKMEKARLGLDKPVLYQFGRWIWDLVHGDFGVSMWTGGPVSHEIAIRFQLSLEVTIMATVLSVILAIPLGTLAALKQDTWIDYVIRVFSIAGLAVPSFWLGILIILMLLIFFGWLPSMVFTPFWKDPWANLSQLIWPVLAVGYRHSAVATRMTRAVVLEVLREDYIRTARAKGLQEKLILTRHALKPALLPIISIVGLEFAFLLGGLVVVEQVFNLNGLGLLLVNSIAMRDYIMIQSLILLFSFFFLLVNFFLDILYAYVDPRIRYT
jgi:peptide/nickel transport system permease protein